MMINYGHTDSRRQTSQHLTTLTTILILLGWLLLPCSAIRHPLNPGVSLAWAALSQEKHHEFRPWPHDRSDLKPDPAVTFGRLSNGFRYVLMNNRRPENRVSLHLYVGAGSLNETDAQRGVAHFLEHMLFNGSTHFPPGELVRYFQSIGMQFGNDANAHTGFDETVYDIILPAGDEQSLKKGLLVMSDYAMGALLLEEEVKRESGVILAEMRSRDSSDYRTFKATLSFELPDTRVSSRLPIGKTEVIKHADRELLKSFYDTWYRPANTVLVMVGDFSVDLAERLIRDQFNAFAPRSPAATVPHPGTVDHKGLKVFFHHEPEAGGATVSIETIGTIDHSPDSMAWQQKRVVERMANRIVQNRLDARLNAPGTPFTAATIGSGVYLNHIRYAEISADSSADTWRQTLAVLEQELRRARLHGFSQAELERVRKEMLSMLENAVKKAATRNSTSLARSIMRSLASDRVFRSPQQEQAILAPVVETVTLANLQEVFKESWPDHHRLVLVTGNADMRNDASSTPERSIRDVYLASASRVVDRTDDEAIAAFPYLNEPEDTGRIASREEIEDLGITRIRFANGIQLNVKQTDFKANEVLANLIFGQGSSSEPPTRPGIALLGEATVNESGLGSMDTTQLEQALAGTSTHVDFRIREAHFSLFAETVSQEVELMFQLLYAHLKDPGFREEALSLARERLQQEYQSFNRSIEGLMRIEGQRFLAGGDSRFGMPPWEQIQSISLIDIRNWVEPKLAQAPLELSIVGDIDAPQVIELARRYLGSLPDRAPTSESTRLDLPNMPIGSVKQIRVETQIPKALVVAAWQTDDFWDIRRTRRLSVLADIFSERLRERIREKLGASYSPYAFNRASRAYAGYGVFQAYVNVAPDQTGLVLSEVNAIARDLVRNGTATDELERAVDPILTSIRELRQTNGYWLNSVMTGLARHPQQIDWARSFLGDYAAVTVDELNGLAATYLTDARAAAIVIRPAELTDS